MIPSETLAILKNFCKLNRNFKLDSEEILVSIEDGSILGSYKVDIKDGLTIFNKFPLNNINQLIDDIEDLKTYNMEISNGGNLMIKGITKRGIDVKIRRSPAVIDDAIEDKIKKVINVFDNMFQEEIEFTMDKNMYEHIIKKSKKVDDGDPIMTIYKEDEQFFIKLHNKMVDDYVQEIKLSNVSEIGNSINSSGLTISILSLTKLPKDNQGYRVIIKSKTIKHGDEDRTIYLINFKPISVQNLDFYMSISI